MQAQLKATMFGLKRKVQFRYRQVGLLRAQIKRRDRRIAELEKLIEAQNQILEPQLIPRHSYPAQMITLAVFIVVLGGGSLRCAAKTVSFFAYLMGWPYQAPSPTTVRNWVLRAGYFALNQAKDLRGAYLAIIDESIQIGKEKLLLLLGVKVPPNYCRIQPLRMQEVEILGMEVQSSWTGDRIANFMTNRLDNFARIKIVGVISDQGTSIKAALRQLNLVWISDCSHMLMNAAKTLFGTDVQLSRFCAHLGQLRRQLALTDLAYLLPPTMRDKDRFHRVFTLVKWAERLDRHYDRLGADAQQHFRFYRRLNYKWVLLRMRQVNQLIVITANILKKVGLSRHAYLRWQKAVENYLATQDKVTTPAKHFIPIVEKYFADHQPIFNHQDQVLCCSDIIESIFGRYKNKGGMKVISADVLAIALYNTDLTPALIKTAMTSVREQDVARWKQKYVCENRYALIRRMDKELKNAGVET